MVGVALLCLALPAWASSTDFTVQGTGSSDVDLPYALTAGGWSVTATAEEDQGRWWINLVSWVDGDTEFFLVEDDALRGSFRVGDGIGDFAPGDAYLDPSSLEGVWSVRFQKRDAQPPPPGPDNCPANRACLGNGFTVGIDLPGSELRSVGGSQAAVPPHARQRRLLLLRPQQRRSPGQGTERLLDQSAVVALLSPGHRSCVSCHRVASRRSR